MRQTRIKDNAVVCLSGKQKNNVSCAKQNGWPASEEN